MSGISVGPSPNWYCSRVIDCNKENIVAYGARGNVCLLDGREFPPRYLDIISAHQDRVTSLAFSSLDHQLLATAAEDNKVKIWNVYTKECLFCVTNIEKVVCIDWHTGLDNVVYIGSEKSGLFVWDAVKKSLVPLRTNEKSSVLLIKSCPYNSNWIAVGYKGGLVAILSVSNSQIIKKFRGHDNDIISLSWSVCDKEENGASLGFLSTSGRDKSVRIWNIEKERCDHAFAVPQIHKTSHYEESNRSRHWSSVIWYPDSTQLLLLTTFTGELLIWDLKKKGKKKWEVFTTEETEGHNKCIFNAVIVKSNTERVYTISLDRQIVLWDLNEKKSICSLPTIGGFCYALEVCPQDVGQLAVGSGEGIIRILNTTRPGMPCISTFWQGIKGKVINLSWHPNKEGMLAFGTEEGRVGIVDTIGNKPPIIFKSFHKESVYRVGWGPDYKFFKQNYESDSKQKLYLYSCGDRVIYIHDPSDVNSHAANFDEFAALTNRSYTALLRTDFAWRSDFSVIAVGNTDGTVEIFSGQNLRLLARIVTQKKLINCLSWHPQFTVVPDSSCSSWLASASNDSIIHVYELLPVLNRPEDDNKEFVTITDSIYQLTGHQARVVTVSWSPHFPGRLVSASYDNTVQVWDTLKGKPLANYRGHKGRVYSVAWSFLSPNNCFSGGEDYSLHCWDSSKQEHNLPPSKQSIKQSKKLKKEQVLPKLSEEDSKIVQELIERKLAMLRAEKEKESTTDNITKVDGNSPKENSNAVQTEDSCNENEGTDSEDDVSLQDSCSVASSLSLIKKSCSSKKKSGKGKKTQKSLFPYSSALENRGKKFGNEDCVFLMDLLTEEKSENKELQAGSDEATHLGLFSDRAAAWRMLSSEISQHKKSNNLDYALQLEIWKGNVGDALREAADKNMLNDYLVSLAPLGSRELWLEMASRYAEQLIASGAIQKSVLYLLSCHKIYKAIDTLRDHGYYREALALAKVRVSPTDPVIPTILKEWAFKANRDNNHHLAAKCYLALREYSRASRQLANITDPTAMQTAAYVSKKSGNKNEAQSYMISSIKLALKKQEWDLAYSIISQHVEIQPLRLVVATHKFICEYVEVLQHSTDNLGWICPLDFMNETEEVTIWKGAVFDSYPFLHRIKNGWIAENLLKVNEDEEKVASHYQFIETALVSQYTSSVKEYYIMLAVELCSLLLICWNKDITNGSIKVTILRRLNRLFSLGNGHFSLNSICLLLFPEEIKWSANNGIRITSPYKENMLMISALENNLEDLIEIKMNDRLLDIEDNAISSDASEEHSYKRTESFISGYFMFNLLCLLGKTVGNFQIFKCDTLNIENEIHEECLRKAKLFTDLLQKIKSSLLIELHAQHKVISQKLTILNQKIAVLNSDKLYKLHETELPGKTSELQLRNGTAQSNHSDEEYCKLKKEQEEVLQEFQALEKLTYGYSFPDPILSAKKIIDICKEFISNCSCNSICEALSDFSNDIHLWLQKFDVD
ncbi:gem-associated protein 5 [Centruroides vittatus]|uniref:gem-associated protein 5 n=1 Tax=Centruroides vittatus TaxID=120091 RepID=UPI0035107582